MVSAAGAKKTCYYELLGLDRKCEVAEIKATYRKLALRMHPDKAHQNGMCPEEATKRFQQIQEAYSVLSDAQERAWYDAHREQILRGDDGPGEDPFKTKINLYKYFSVSCFDGFGNDSRGFYAVYSELFEAIDAEEQQWEDADESEDYTAMPPFGRADTEWADVSSFYRNWLDFCSRKAFGHADQWNPKDASNRQVRRAMEQENKKARQAAKKEFNAEVRQLVKFVQKRDPRYQAHQKQQMKENIEKNQRERAEKDRKKADEAKDKEERKAAARQAEEERWAEAKALKEEQRARGEVVSEEEEEESEELVEYFCEPCRKSFKSEKAFDQHAKSKKHLQVVAKLRKELDRELKEEAKAAKAQCKEKEEEEEEDDESPGPVKEEKKPQVAAPAAASKQAKEEKKAPSESAEDDSKSQSGSDSEDNFLSRFAAQKQGSRGGYPQAAQKESEEEEESEDEQQEDIRGRRAQKKEQQMAAALQRLQEREAEPAGGKNRKKEAADLSAKDGPIPEGNTCGVCGEDFSSRSLMFKHIKATGHAMLKPAAADEPVKGKKKKR